MCDSTSPSPSSLLRVGREWSPSVLWLCFMLGSLSLSGVEIWEE